MFLSYTCVVSVVYSFFGKQNVNTLLMTISIILFFFTDAQTILSDINPRDRPDLRPVDGQLPPSTDLRPPVQIDPLGDLFFLKITKLCRNERSRSITIILWWIINNIHRFFFVYLRIWYTQNKIHIGDNTFRNLKHVLYNANRDMELYPCQNFYSNTH